MRRSNPRNRWTFAPPIARLVWEGASLDGRDWRCHGTGCVFPPSQRDVSDPGDAASAARTRLRARPPQRLVRGRHREAVYAGAAVLVGVRADECGGLQSLWECPCRVSGEADGGGDHGLRHVGVQQAQRRGGPDLPGVGARHRGAPPHTSSRTCRGAVARGCRAIGWKVLDGNCICSDGASPAGVAHHRRGTAARQGAGGL